MSTTGARQQRRPAPPPRSHKRRRYTSGGPALAALSAPLASALAQAKRHTSGGAATGGTTGSRHTLYTPDALLRAMRRTLEALDDVALVYQLATTVLETSAVVRHWTKNVFQHYLNRPVPHGRPTWSWLVTPLYHVLEAARDLTWRVTLSNDFLTLWCDRSLISSEQDLWSIPLSLLSTRGLAAVLELEQRSDRLFARHNAHRLYHSRCRLDALLAAHASPEQFARLSTARLNAALHFLVATRHTLLRANAPWFVVNCELQRTLSTLMESFSARRPDHRPIRAWVWKVLSSLACGSAFPACTGADSRDCLLCTSEQQDRGTSLSEAALDLGGRAQRSEYALMLDNVDRETQILRRENEANAMDRMMADYDRERAQSAAV